MCQTGAPHVSFEAFAGLWGGLGRFSFRELADGRAKREKRDSGRPIPSIGS
jgi:hypothetical protein